jgi:hypothetical protein
MAHMDDEVCLRGNPSLLCSVLLFCARKMQRGVTTGSILTPGFGVSLQQLGLPGPPPSLDVHKLHRHVHADYHGIGSQSC